MTRKLTCVSLLVAGLLLASPARAQLTARVQLDGSAFFDAYTRAERVWETDSGLGLGGLLGYRLRVGPVELTPEVGVGYYWFSDPYKRDTLRVVGGGRVALPLRVRPALYLHAGWARAEGVDYDAVLQRRGPTVDVGVGLDYPVTRWWVVGLQLGYNALIADTGSGREVAHWINAGVASGFVF